MRYDPCSDEFPTAYAIGSGAMHVAKRLTPPDHRTAHGIACSHATRTCNLTWCRERGLVRRFCDLRWSPVRDSLAVSPEACP
jgi:hypothetical protein